jgi:pterin-4a-carbinolamine dehydratase
VSESPTLPLRDDLAASIAALVDQQAIAIRQSNWKSDLLPLFQRLEGIGFKRKGTLYRFPTGRLVQRDLVPRALSEDELVAELAKRPGWSKEVSPLPGEHPRIRTEITRAYVFRSFEDAIEFMRSAAEHVSAVDHQPRWENVWKTVRVWLSTWDIGHLPSHLDFELASNFDKLFEAYSIKRAGRAEPSAVADPVRDISSGAS